MTTQQRAALLSGGPPKDGPMPQAQDGSKWDAAKLKKAATITCPIMTTLFVNGDLECTEEGLATKEQLMDALRRTGLRNDDMASALAGAAKDGPINIFKMDGGAKFEHSVSTGARDPGFNEEKFQKMAEFADENKRLYAPQWNNLLKYFTANPNDVNTNSNMRRAGVPGRGVDMMAVSGAMLVAFGRDEKGDGKSLYLTVDDLRGLYEFGKYPQGWVVREWGFANVAKATWSILRARWCSCFGSKADVVETSDDSLQKL